MTEENTAPKTFQEYQQQKRQREWNERVQKQKESMGNAERVERARDWKQRGNEKFKAGNLMEALDYYSEAVVFMEDMVEARRKERNELLVPLYSNLAQVHLRLDDGRAAEEAAGKALAICEVAKNGFGPAATAKAQYRRGVARQALGRLEEARDDLAASLRLQPSPEAERQLGEVRSAIAARAREERERMGGFLNRQAGERQAREEQQRLRARKERQAEERRRERKARAEQRQQMQTAFARLSEGEMLYEQREREMEPVREKEKEQRKTLELEQNLLNIIDGGKGKQKTEDFDEFMQKKLERCQEQNSELDQKKKVLDKQRKEGQWGEDDAWRAQRDRHREQLEERRRRAGGEAGPRSLWESREVCRWCEQRLRDLLVGCSAEGQELDEGLAAGVLQQSRASSRGYVLRALVVDALKLEGDAAVMRLNLSKAPLYYFDYFLKLEWEVAVARPGDKLYRTADELITSAAHSDDQGATAPRSVVEHRALGGTFKIREFCSEEEPADGRWQLATKTKVSCPYGPELAELSEVVRDALRESVVSALGRWVSEYREHWRC